MPRLRRGRRGPSGASWTRYSIRPAACLSGGLQEKRTPPVDKTLQAVVTTIDTRGEPLRRVELASVGFYVRRNHRLVLPDERLERAPVEPFVRDLADVAEISRSQRRHREQLRSQRLAGVIETNQRIELGTCRAERRGELEAGRQLNAGRKLGRTAASASARPSRAAALVFKTLVHVVGQHVHAPHAVEIDVVVAGARPVAVGVDERDVESQELQGAIDVEQRG